MKKKQIREENARVIARIVKESFEKFRDEEKETYITFPKPEKCYCIEWKFYETPQIYNAELNKRESAYNAGQYAAAKKILTDLYNTRPEDLKNKMIELAREYHVFWKESELCEI